MVHWTPPRLEHLCKGCKAGPLDLTQAVPLYHAEGGSLHHVQAGPLDHAQAGLVHHVQASRNIPEKHEHTETLSILCILC